MQMVIFSNTFFALGFAAGAPDLLTQELKEEFTGKAKNKPTPM